MKVPLVELLVLTTLGRFSAANAAAQLVNTPEQYFGGTANRQPYLDWIAAKTVEERYNASTFLPGSEAGQGAAIHWTIQGDELHMALAVRAMGWAAFGLSQAGGMLGSDIVYWQVSEPTTLTDAYVVEDRFPAHDGCDQDWVLADTDLTHEGFIMWEGRRKLVTGDSRDLPIISDSEIAVSPHRVIAAWGDSDTVGYHGRNVARGSIRFEAPNTDELVSQMQNATATFFVGAQNFTIPRDVTTYEGFCVTKNDILSLGIPDQYLHIIAFEPILSPETELYVHHFTVHAVASAQDDACEEEVFMELVYVWAPGEPALLLPDYLGGPLFGTSGINGFRIEIHYNNPGLESGLFDSSGVRFYVSDQLRENEVGVLQLGDPFVILFGEPVGGGLSKHTFECPGSCSQLALIDEPVTVLREYLHMHQAGVRVVNEQFRDGEKVREGSVEVWEFDQQGNAVVLQQPFQIVPGDSFRTSCYYRETNSTNFGLGSDEEMCIAFIFYFPRKLISNTLPWICGYQVDFLGVCDSPYESIVLPSEAAIGRHFGQVSATSKCEDDSQDDLETNQPTVAPSGSGTFKASQPTATPSGSGTFRVSQPTATPSGSGKFFKAFDTMALVAGTAALMWGILLN